MLFGINRPQTAMSFTRVKKEVRADSPETVRSTSYVPQCHPSFNRFSEPQSTPPAKKVSTTRKTRKFSRGGPRMGIKTSKMFYEQESTSDDEYYDTIADLKKTLLRDVPPRTKSALGFYSERKTSESA